MTPARRELRTCPVEGGVVLINPLIQSRPEPTRAPVETGTGWHPHDPPWVGIEGDTRLQREPAVTRDGLGAHEVLHGALPEALRLAGERMQDLRGDTRLRGFHLAGEAINGKCTGLELIALPFDRAGSAPCAWRDREIGDVRCLCVEDQAVAILAWAPRTPLETWVLPRYGREGFGAPDVPGVGALAERALAWLNRALPNTGVDIVLVEGEPWRLELRPRLCAEGLFNAATGIPAHGGFPEEGAAFLKDFCRNDDTAGLR